MERLATARSWAFSPWRWLVVGATLTVVLASTATWLQFAMGAATLIAGALLALLVPAESVEHLRTRGWPILADAALVLGVLLTAARVPAFVHVAFLAVICIAVLTGDRLRTLLAALTVTALLATLAGEGVLPGVELTLTALLYVPLIATAAVHFGGLASHLPSHAGAVRRATRETDELRALLHIAETMGRTLDVGEVMRTIVGRVGELVDTDSCSIVSSDRERQNCFVVASKGHPEIDMLEIDLDNYPEIRRALETREPVVIDDIKSNPLIASAREHLLEQGYRSMLIVPLLYGDEVLGTLFVRARHERKFTRGELRFCKVAAGAGANALKNALLYQDVKREATEHLETGETLRRILDGSPSMIVATDRDGRVTLSNRGAQRLTGRSSEGLAGHSLDEILSADLSALMPADADGCEPTDVAFRRADGDPVELSLVTAPLLGPEGERVGDVWIGRDVTKLRRVEKSLAQAERLSSLGEVVAGVAHELNNPLSGVVGYAELLRVNATEADQIRDLDRIVESAIRCQKIVLKLLSFARKHTPEMRYQNLNDCVSKVLDLKSYHLKSSQIRVVLELDEHLPQTCFDFHQLEQVILNLLNNAEHALCSIRRPGTITLRTGVEDGFVYFELSDDGPGVPAAVRDRIFDPFFTTKDIGMGTGLGLSVSYGIVEEHGGAIEHRQATEEGGAVFKVNLPLVKGDAAVVEDDQAAVAITRRQNPLRGRRILVAEDEPMVLELFSRLLRAEGAEVTLTEDGEQAWAELAEQDFDLIVADLRMPNMSGQQLYERASAERPELARRFVFATGDLAREETVDFLEHVPNRILHKPLEVETVRRVLGQAIQQEP